jgi:hypothetical protein
MLSVMPHRRPRVNGSFGGHFEELVKHFPHDEPQRPRPETADEKALKEKRDIHALLFEMAWKLEGEDENRF